MQEVLLNNSIDIGHQDLTVTAVVDIRVNGSSTIAEIIQDAITDQIKINDTTVVEEGNYTVVLTAIIQKT